MLLHIHTTFQKTFEKIVGGEWKLTYLVSRYGGYILFHGSFSKCVTLPLVIYKVGSYSHTCSYTSILHCLVDLLFLAVFFIMVNVFILELGQ